VADVMDDRIDCPKCAETRQENFRLAGEVERLKTEAAELRRQLDEANNRPPRTPYGFTPGQ
jgi:sarcosine oxidase delta subunit